VQTVAFGYVYIALTALRGCPGVSWPNQAHSNGPLIILLYNWLPH
jgi:hypothetical protein